MSTMDGEFTKIGTALIEQKVTPKKFSRGDLKSDGDIRRLTWRGGPLSSAHSGFVQIMPDTNLLEHAAGLSFRS